MLDNYGFPRGGPQVWTDTSICRPSWQGGHIYLTAKDGTEVVFPEGNRIRKDREGKTELPYLVFPLNPLIGQ